jgi:uncharacterized delta-60 repeat protein
MRRFLAMALFGGLVLLVVGSAQGTRGTLAASFNSIRHVKAAPPSAVDYATALVRQPDGKVVAAGGSRDDLALARYKPNGSLDRTFGTGGKVTTAFGRRSAGANALVRQPDGKLVAAGNTYTYNGSKVLEDFVLARYKPDGSLDRSFGRGGKVTTAFGSDYNEAWALVQQPDGKLVAAGVSFNGSDYVFSLARYKRNGSLDPSFGTGGKVTTGLGAFPTPVGRGGVDALLLQPDGKLVAAGRNYDTSGASYFALARYNPDGSLDPSFGRGGEVTTSFGPDDEMDEALALGLQPDGKLVAAGEYDDGFAFARYDPSGSIDSSFNGTGKVTIRIGSQDLVPAVFALVLQPDGKLVAAGTNDHFALVRYKRNGSLDKGFGRHGKVTTAFGPHEGGALALVRQPDAKLVAAGITFDISGGDFALARYKRNGSLDRSFGKGGKVTTAFRCVVPKVKGWKLPVARHALRYEDCSVGTVRRAFSATMKKGRVISQKPKPGAKRQPGAKVKLKVSKGKRR